MLAYRVMHPIDGRGPWRPGFSHHWTTGEDHRPDETTQQLMRGIDFRPLMLRYRQFGTVCPTLEMLAVWFTKQETLNLERIGYLVCHVTIDQILKVGRYQNLVASKQPFHKRYRDLGWKSILDLK